MAALARGPEESPAAEEGAGETASQTALAPGTGADGEASADKQPTLLELRDGTMYGLTDYWVEGDKLHYRTTYGGEDAVSFERIDVEKTIELNAERGMKFVLRPRPTGIEASPGK